MTLTSAAGKDGGIPWGRSRFLLEGVVADLGMRSYQKRNDLCSPGKSYKANAGRYSNVGKVHNLCFGTAGSGNRRRLALDRQDQRQGA